MAVVISNDTGWIISHESIINSVYERTVYLNKIKSYFINPDLFDIQVPFVKSKNFSENLLETDIEEVKVVKKSYQSLYDEFQIKRNIINEKQLSNASAKFVADTFYSFSNTNIGMEFHGGNNSSDALVSAIKNEHFLIPKNCKFFCYDVKSILNYLQNEQYDFILLDPPWWNKYVRRKKKKNRKFGYEMMFDKDLVNIPIPSLLKVDGIVGIWCTNASSHINTILCQLFPAWNLQYIGQWFWLKVTKFGKPICDFSKSFKKQPFERIIFGVRKNFNRQFSNPNKDKVIISIPSAIHSHKPPLVEIMKPYLPQEPKCLELFARYLLPEWTSYGNEVLKLQHISLYNELDLEKNS